MKTWKKVSLALLAPWTSKKLWMTILAVIVIQSLFWTSVYYLYSFTEQWKGELFYKMFNSAMWTISMMMLGYLGLDVLAGGWTNTTSTIASSALQSVFRKSEEKVDITITEKIDPKVVEKYAEKYAGDESYRPIDTVPDCDEEVFR